MKCNHCGKTYQKKDNKDKCQKCEEQYISVFERIMQKYDGSVKQLAER